MDLEKYDFILSVGTYLEDKNLLMRLEKACKTGANFTFMHPIDNFDLKNFYKDFIKYEVGSEEAVLALILNFFTKKDELKEYLEELDIGYLSAESSCGEEELESAFENYCKASKKALIVGNDIKNHQSFENILSILKNIEKYTDFKLLFIDESMEKSFKNSSNFALNEPKDLESFNGTILYFLDDKSLGTKLKASQTFLNIAKLKDKDFVSFSINNQNFKRQIVLEINLLGTIALIDEKIDSYAFSKVVLVREKEEN